MRSLRQATKEMTYIFSADSVVWKHFHTSLGLDSFDLIVHLEERVARSGFE